MTILWYADLEESSEKHAGLNAIFDDLVSEIQGGYELAVTPDEVWGPERPPDRPSP